MSDSLCGSNDCAAHVFMVGALDELKDMNRELKSGQDDLKATVIKLTENLSEMRRTNDKMDLIFAELRAKDIAQDEEIRKNKSFVDKATAIYGLAVVVVPVILGWLLK